MMVVICYLCAMYVLCSCYYSIYVLVVCYHCGDVLYPCYYRVIIALFILLLPLC